MGHHSESTKDDDARHKRTSTPGSREPRPMLHGTPASVTTILPKAAVEVVATGSRRLRHRLPIQAARGIRGLSHFCPLGFLDHEWTRIFAFDFLPLRKIPASAWPALPSARPRRSKEPADFWYHPTCFLVAYWRGVQPSCCFARNLMSKATPACKNPL